MLYCRTLMFCEGPHVNRITRTRLSSLALGGAAAAFQCEGSVFARRDPRFITALPLFLSLIEKPVLPDLNTSPEHLKRQKNWNQLQKNKTPQIRIMSLKIGVHQFFAVLDARDPSMFLDR